jgi:hypothetical protein
MNIEFHHPIREIIVAMKWPDFYFYFYFFSARNSGVSQLTTPCLWLVVGLKT